MSTCSSRWIRRSVQQLSSEIWRVYRREECSTVTMIISDVSNGMRTLSGAGHTASFPLGEHHLLCSNSTLTSRLALVNHGVGTRPAFTSTRFASRIRMEHWRRLGRNRRVAQEMPLVPFCLVFSSFSCLPWSSIVKAVENLRFVKCDLKIGVLRAAAEKVNSKKWIRANTVVF